MNDKEQRSTENASSPCH